MPRDLSQQRLVGGGNPNQCSLVMKSSARANQVIVVNRRDR